MKPARTDYTKGYQNGYRDGKRIRSVKTIDDLKLQIVQLKRSISNEKKLAYIKGYNTGRRWSFASVLSSTKASFKQHHGVEMPNELAVARAINRLIKRVSKNEKRC